MNYGTLIIDQSEIKGGSANSGGAIANETAFATARLEIEASTLDDNQAALGGAIYNTGSTAIENSTIAGNSAVQGGGIYSDAGSAILVNVTVSANSASDTAGGIDAQVAAGAFRLLNTIVAGNASPDADVAGAFVSLGHNLISNVGAATGFTAGANGDLVGGAGAR